MKRTQMAALLAGAALGLTGVAVAVTLSRKEGRDAAKRLLDRTAPVAAQARTVGGRVARSAAGQYQTLAPKAAGALSTVRSQAPVAVGAVSSRLPWIGQNGTAAETAE
ncbi:MAG: hypothetical protein ACHQ4H_09650 [Ktedonobacterales bacterium]